jgi:CheY-like chemotaxis protein
VLLDLRLRDHLDGWDLLAVLRAHTDTRDLPVIIVSAEDQRDRSRALGVDDYFIKPVEKNALLAKLAWLAPISPGTMVLVVDDDTSTRELALATLELAGVPARGVGSGEEALALLDEHPAAYGLVVLDLGLPGMDGFAVLEALGGRPSLVSVPVVIFTARQLELGEQQRLLQRAREVVRKGNGVPLGEAVGRWLGHPLASEPSARLDTAVEDAAAAAVPG